MLRKTNVMKSAKMELRRQITNPRKNPLELVMKASSPLHGVMSKQNFVGSNSPNTHAPHSFGKHLEISAVFLFFCSLQYSSKQLVLSTDFQYALNYFYNES